MTIDVRAKGANGEREVADMMNLTINTELYKAGLQVCSKPVVQRNQNQSAVGGSDLTNPFGLCIEVKRQENLSVNTWWNQCTKAAKEFGGIPVLVFKQNRKPWRVVMLSNLQFPGHPNACMEARVEISWDDFQQWFRGLVFLHISKGNDSWAIR